MKNPADGCIRHLLVAALFTGLTVVASPLAVFAQASGPGQEILTLTGHRGWPTGLHGPVWSVAYSPDGKRIASGGEDRVLRVWDAVDGKERLALKGHAGPIRTVAFSPDGNWLASGGDGVKIWDATNGKELRSLRSRLSGVRDIAFSPDGKWIAAAAVHSRTVMVWDVATGAVVFSLKGPTNWAESVAFSPDGKWLAAGGHDGDVKLWDASTGRESKTFKGHSAGAVVRGLSFSPNGKQLADASVDGTIKLWDVGSGREITTLKARGMLYDVTFSPDGKRLATCSHKARVTEWDVTSGRKTLSLKALADRQTAQFVLNRQNPTTNFVYAVAYRQDGKQLVAASSDGLIRVWSVVPQP